MQRLLNTLRTALLCGTALAAASGAAYAADMSMKDMEDTGRKLGISFTLAGTTDYVFRGVSQTDEKPTVQMSLDLTYGIFYAGVWGSGIDFDDIPPNSNVEVDFYAGIKPSAGGFDFDFGLIYYHYPRADDGGAELDYIELKAAVSKTVFETLTLGAAVYYSPEYTGETGEAWTVEASFSKALPKIWDFDLTLSGLIGYNEADELEGYTYWNIGLTKTYKNFAFDVRYHDTDLDGCDGATVFQCDERVVGTVKVTLD
jgi:uncharacterized protein (TIGR02001 family)